MLNVFWGNIDYIRPPWDEYILPFWHHMITSISVWMTKNCWTLDVIVEETNRYTDKCLNVRQWSAYSKDRLWLSYNRDSERYFSQVMSKNRFQSILRILYSNDNVLTCTVPIPKGGQVLIHSTKYDQSSTFSMVYLKRTRQHWDGHHLKGSRLNNGQ